MAMRGQGAGLCDRTTWVILGAQDAVIPQESVVHDVTQKAHSKESKSIREERSDIRNRAEADD